MAEKEKIDETENPILTDALTPVKKPRKPRKKKMVENGILDESVIPEDTIPESSRLTEKTPESVKEETYVEPAPASKNDEGNPGGTCGYSISNISGEVQSLLCKAGTFLESASNHWQGSFDCVDCVRDFYKCFLCRDRKGEYPSRLPRELFFS